MITLSRFYPAVGHAWLLHECIYAGPVATMIPLLKSTSCWAWLVASRGRLCQAIVSK